MSGPLKGVVVVFAKLNECTTLPPEKVLSWTRAAGGKVAENVGPGVTHLVTSKRDYEAKGKAVALARKFPKMKVVHWEWLERSLFNKFLMCHELFLLKEQVDKAREQKQIRARKRKSEISKLTRQFIDYKAKVMLENTESLRTPGYDIAVDLKGQACDVILFHIDKENNRTIRTILRMCRTVSEPYYYGAYAIYRDQEGNEQSEVLRYAPSQFYQVFPIFRNFFVEWTGYDWLNRPAKVTKPADGFWAFF